jgi:hypothetical protein
LGAGQGLLIGLRYTCRDENVFAIINGAEGSTWVTLEEVAVSSSTTVETLDGRPLRWRVSPLGVTVDLADQSMPTVVVLGHVNAR